MPRPYRAGQGLWIGWAALALSVLIGLLYLPGSPSALVWPYEWAIFLGWSAIGGVFYLWARSQHLGEADRVVMQELRSGHSDLPESA